MLVKLCSSIVERRSILIYALLVMRYSAARKECGDV